MRMNTSKRNKSLDWIRCYDEISDVNNDPSENCAAALKEEGKKWMKIYTFGFYLETRWIRSNWLVAGLEIKLYVSNNHVVQVNVQWLIIGFYQIIVVVTVIVKLGQLDLSS